MSSPRSNANQAASRAIRATSILTRYHTSAMPTRAQTMSGAFVPGVGAVFSADIAVPDHEREARFE
jgi:hypothetical protein